MSEPLVLVVDDDHDLREVISLILTAHGYRIEEACDGLDALNQLQHGRRPSVVLLDLRMPRMNGAEFLRAFRSTPAGDIPVVAMTGDACAASGAIEAGADACLRKPIEARTLLEAIRMRVREDASVAAPCASPGDARQSSSRA